MERGWPAGGPWLIAATSARVDWRLAVAVLAAAAEVPVAAVVVGAALAGDDPARPHLAGVVELPVTDRLGLAQARDLVRGVGRAYELVLVSGPAGLLVPIGRDDWTLADLAAAIDAPAVVVTGPGPDAANHTTLALGALAGLGIVASVVAIGDVDREALPLRPAGVIPAEPPAGLDGAAGWLEPALRATGRGTPEARPPQRPATSGKRVVLGLLAVFVALVAVVCGMAWASRDGSEVELHATTVRRGAAPAASRLAVPAPVRSPAFRRRTATDVCPQFAGPIAPTRPDAATTARVGAAWRRIERWLGTHAPAGARALGRPAGAGPVDDLQRRMSVAFPPDLVASLRRHNGVSAGAGFTLPPFFAPATIESIFADWQVNCGVLADGGTEWTDAWWDRAFVPFAEAGDGGSLVLDQRAGGRGRVGEFYPEDGTTFDHRPGSLAELLEQTATSVETGRPYAGRYRPRVDGSGGLDWEII